MIELREVGKSYGAVRAVDGVSLQVASGEFVALIGASGSGKSTLLKMINRLVEHDRGSVWFHGEEVRAFKPEALRRRMGYAIQSIGLFPHWTVARNIATVPQLLGWTKARIAARVDELLALLGLEPGQYRDRWPHQLSGGQQQRVGVARALAADPEVLLMDEPFGALDPMARQSLQQELQRIHRTSGKTIVMVTHDVDEAVRLATRIVLLDHGRVAHDGTPTQLLARPGDDFVRAFFGGDELALRLLALQRVGDRMRRGEPAAGEPLAHTASLREALAAFVVRATTRLPVADADSGRLLGAIEFSDLFAAPVPPLPP